MKPEVTKTKKRQPLVSVVMPVYNAGKFLEESIESILSQSYKNFEFIIVDDASTDNSWSILQKYAQRYKRIKIDRNKKRMGVSITVKKAIVQAQGEFIARMDADDIALPNRIEKQIQYLQENPRTVAVGGQCLIINEQKEIIGEKVFPTDFKQIYKYIFHFVPVQQPTLMIARTRLPIDFEYYRDGMNTAEEVELYFKFFKYGKVENLPDYIHLYRLHSHNTSLENVRKTFLLTLLSRILAIIKYEYKPTFTGLIITLAQTVVTLILPNRVTIALYKYLRKMLPLRPLALVNTPPPSNQVIQ